MHLKKMKKRIWQLLYGDIGYIFLNYFVEYIPFWTIRKGILKLCGMKIGKQSRIAMRCIIMSPSHIELGEGNVINEHVLLDGRGGLKIGNNNSISMFSKIYTGTHSTSSGQFDCISFPTEIKDNCWVGTSAILLPGTELNDFVVISANSLFKGIANEKEIYMGVPAKKIKDRNIDNKYDMDFVSWFR